MSPGIGAWDDVHRLCATYDAALKIERATGCYWSGSLRLSLTDPLGEPSRSITFYATGHGNPESVARILLRDAERWMAESSVAPMPAPEWAR